MRYVEVFADHGGGGHVAAREQFVGARAQDLEHGLVDPRHRPAGGEARCDQAVDLLAPRVGAADDIVEERSVGLEVLLVLDLRAQAVLVELVEQPRHRGLLHLELVERLDRGEPRGGSRLRGRLHIPSLTSIDRACADIEQVLATVVSAVYSFMEEENEAWVYATGSTKSRTRLYRMGITKYFDDVKEDFSVFGLRDGEWEEFTKEIDYTAFVVKRK